MSGGRLFFALWPPAEVAGPLAAAGARCAADGGGRAVPRERIHLTLAFLGELDADGCRRALEVGATLPLVPFELVLDRVQHQRRQRMLWATGAAVPALLTTLVNALRERLHAAELPVESRDFRVHVTLVRGTLRDPGASAVGTVRWPVDGLVLARSRLQREGACYEVIARWPAGGDSNRAG